MIVRVVNDAAEIASDVQSRRHDELPLRGRILVGYGIDSSHGHGKRVGTRLVSLAQQVSVDLEPFFLEL